MTKQHEWSDTLSDFILGQVTDWQTGHINLKVHLQPDGWYVSYFAPGEGEFWQPGYQLTQHMMLLSEFMQRLHSKFNMGAMADAA